MNFSCSQVVSTRRGVAILRQYLLFVLSAIVFFTALPASAEQARPKTTAAPAAPAPASPAQKLIETKPLDQSADFKAQPLAILSKFPKAGPALASFVADLVSKQPQVMEAIISVIEVATPEQASAIGAGMVRAARTLLKSNPQIVRLMEHKISNSENLWLKTTFRALGYSYISNQYVSPPLIKPTELSKNPIGTTIKHEKSELSDVESYRKNSLRVPADNAERGIAGNDFKSIFSGYGTIVAIIVSNASNNGAASTSPTN